MGDQDEVTATKGVHMASRMSGIAAVAAALSMAVAAGPAAAAPSPAISVSDRSVYVGQVVEFSASGLDPASGYYVMLCQNQPSFFAICARPGEIADSFVHLSNRDTQAHRISKAGTASGRLRIALHDTSLFGPIPNDTRINCALGGYSVAIVEDHQHSTSPGGMVPRRIAAVGVSVR